MLLLVVKGTVVEAMRAAVGRGVTPFKPARELVRFGETLGYAPDDRWEACARWYVESNTLEPGTLLWYHRLDKEVITEVA